MNIVTKSIKELGFNINMNMKVKTYEDLSATQKALVPKADDKYKFREEELLDVLVWFNEPICPLYMFGPSGTGKTSLIKEICARINKPCVELVCHSRMEAADLIGTYVLGKSDPSDKQPSMLWSDGPLVKAMREGALLLINEYDLGDPSQMSALNGVLEERELLIEAHCCEKVVAADGFCVVATANTNGSANDMNGSYQGCNQLNAAQLDRFLFMKVDYMKKDDEVEMLFGLTQGRIYKEFIEKLVDVANTHRQKFADGDVNVPFTTRKLRDFLRRISLFYGSPLSETEIVVKGIRECFSLRGADPSIEGAILEHMKQALLGVSVFNPQA